MRLKLLQLIVLGVVQVTFGEEPICVTTNSTLLVNGVASDPLSFCSASCSCNSTAEDVPVGDPEENLALAFGLVSAAGLSTTIGAALVIRKCLHSLIHLTVF